MPIALTRIPKRWTRKECATLELSGLLDQQRVELVEGELINKAGKKRPRVNALTLVQRWLVQAFGPRFVNAAAPIDVAPEDNPTNEPEPDLIVLNQDLSHFTSNPRARDLRLVVEIADTSLNFDLTVKAALYARAELFEYWVLDVVGRRLFVHRNPQSGAYTDISVYDQHERVSPLAAAHALSRVADAFPGAPG